MKKINLKPGSSNLIIESNIDSLLKQGFSYDKAEEIAMKKACRKKQSHRNSDKRNFEDKEWV